MSVREDPTQANINIDATSGSFSDLTAADMLARRRAKRGVDVKDQDELRSYLIKRAKLHTIRACDLALEPYSSPTRALSLQMVTDGV